MEVEEEMDAVSAVYGEDVVENEACDGGGRSVLIRINPDVAGHEALVHASLSIRIMLSNDYPASAAGLTIEDVAGVSEEDRATLKQLLADKSQELMGESSLFELLQMCKDFVNDKNIPSDDCCICMCPFDEEEPFVKAACSHSFHCECLARWIHDQRVQAEDKKEEGGLDNKDGCEGKAGSGAICALCRGDVGEDRLGVLKGWLEPLWEEHERELTVRREREEYERQVADSDELLRRERERKEKETKDLNEWRAKPLVVVHSYEHNNLKLLRHTMMPLGAIDCRIVRTLAGPGGQKAGLTAAAWFPCMDKAERAVRTLAREGARVATFWDSRRLPPDFVNRPNS